MTGRQNFKRSSLIIGALGLILTVPAVAIDDGDNSVLAATLQSGTSVWDGVYTEEQAARGQKAYVQDCAQCHLEDLLGDGIASALIGEPFTFRWSDLSVGDMFVVIRTTMPEGAAGNLSRRRYLDIISYLLQANEFPAGDTPLPRRASALEQIIIQADPPQ